MTTSFNHTPGWRHSSALCSSEEIRSSEDNRKPLSGCRDVGDSDVDRCDDGVNVSARLRDSAVFGGGIGDLEIFSSPKVKRPAALKVVLEP